MDPSFCVNSTSSGLGYLTVFLEIWWGPRTEPEKCVVCMVGMPVCRGISDRGWRTYTGLSDIAWLSTGGKASWSLAHPNILEIGILGCHISSGEDSPELIADVLLLLLRSGLVWHIEISSKSTCHLAQDHTSIQKATARIQTWSS